MSSSCLILGDSIAVGVSWYADGCTVLADVGLSSGKWVNRYLAQVKVTDRAVISLGANDAYLSAASPYLRLIRERLHTTKVVWLLPPNHPEIRAYITKLAAEFGDRTIDTRNGPLAPDRIHPSRAHYRAIAEEALS